MIDFWVFLILRHFRYLDIQEALAYALFTFVGQFSGEMTRLKINDFKNCDIPRKQRLVFDWGGRSEKDFFNNRETHRQ